MLPAKGPPNSLKLMRISLPSLAGKSKIAVTMVQL